MLWPLLAVSATAAFIVAVLSSVAGRQWAIHEVQERFDAIEQTIQEANYPLTTAVVASLAKLSGTELISLDDGGRVIENTLAGNSPADFNEVLRSFVVPGEATATETAALELGHASYLAISIRRSSERMRSDKASQVVVLFDESRVRASGRRAALLPLVTGISTIALLATLMTAMTGRLAGRLAILQRSVEKVAAGDFESPVADNSTDEVGYLGRSVDEMAAQLKQLWQQVNRQQSQKLLHQIAGGMAHQLRNSLTGARLALELHRQSCPSSDHQEVDIALREMEGAEDYVRRLLLVGAGEQQAYRPASALVCLNDVRSSHAAVAKHLHVQLNWDLNQLPAHWEVDDGATFSAAIANLVLNGLQAAKHVCVQAVISGPTTCSVTVSDDGPGIAPYVAEHLFEPFITTKPEGMGLGLPLVRRAADTLAGQVEWKRKNDRTIFEFRCRATLK